MKAKFVDCGRGERSLKRDLKELAGCAIGQRETVARRRRSVEVTVRTAEALVVVGDAESVLVVEDAVDLAERRVLVEASRERASGRLYLGCESRIVGKEVGWKTT